MRVWEVLEPSEDGVFRYVRKTEEEILCEYKPQWHESLAKRGLSVPDKTENDECIKDWCNMNWAVPVDPFLVQALDDRE